MPRPDPRYGQLVAESAIRSQEGLRLYRPMPHQMPFHLTNAPQRIVRGGNRAGKSTTVAAEVASAATGIGLLDPNGNPIPHKYPTNRPLIIWCIGYEEVYLGQTIHRLLFQPGAYKLIPDKVTGVLRAFRPWSTADIPRREQCVPSHPFIPPRLVKPDSWVFDGKASACNFSQVELTNGTKIFGFSSGANPKMGDPVDIVWINEDVQNERHIGEWLARLADNNGWLIWDAFPHSRNNALWTMSQRAADQKSRAKPDIVEFRLRFSDNPFIEAETKRVLRESWGEEESRARDEGEFTFGDTLMYPGFSSDYHGCPANENDVDASENDAIDRAVMAHHGVPPAEWTRYLWLDPGHSVCAVLFAAVPPPELGDAIVCYNELYCRRMDAHQVGRQVLAIASGFQFELFGIDARAGVQTQLGRGETVMQHYANCLRHWNVQSLSTGSGFKLGSANVGAGIMAVRAALSPGVTGRPRLRIVRQNMPHFIHEINTYRKNVHKEFAKDDPAPNQNDHLMDCLRYLCADNPRYVPPRAIERPPSAAWAAFKEMWAKRKKNDESIHLGPGVAA